MRAELFASILNEVAEETGVPKDRLDPAVCIGIVQRVMNHRPIMMFVIQCRLTASQVLESYAHAADKFESTYLIFLDKTTLIQQVLHDASLPMPGCQRGGIELYSHYLEFHGSQQVEASTDSTSASRYLG